MSESVDDRYIDECVANSALSQAARALALPPTYAKSFGGLLLDRPMFAAERDLAAFSDDLGVIFEILVSLPGILFDGDLRRYCAALGMDERLAGLMLKGATGRPVLHARADAYHDGSAFKLLEFNLGSELGGTDAAQLNRAFVQVPAFGEFARKTGLAFVDTAGRVAGELRRAAAPVTGSDTPSVALVESTGGIAGHEHVFMAVREAMHDHGIELHLGEIQELGERDGKLTLRGQPLDVVLRYFVAGDLVEAPGGAAALDLILRADRANKTALFTPLEAGLFASKGSLGMLHEARLRDCVSAAQRAAIDRLVPWTRLLADSPWQQPGERSELIEYCRAKQADLVLKPGVGYGAVGAFLGRDTPADQWNAVLDNPAAGDYVVQRMVTPRPERVLNPDTGEIQDWHANWGIFIDGGGYAGAFVRALKPADGTIISYSNPGTRGTCVFSYPEVPGKG